MLAEGVTVCCCCCCAEIGSACRRLLGTRKVTKINYLIMVLAFVVPLMLAVYLLELLGNWLHLSPGYLTTYTGKPSPAVPSSSCWSSYRCWSSLSAEIGCRWW